MAARDAFAVEAAIDDPAQLGPTSHEKLKRSMAYRTQELCPHQGSQMVRLDFEPYGDKFA
jgi:hypothetical protein